MIDHTHNPAARSWVVSSNGHPDFPLQNLPLGTFVPPGAAPRCGVAIGQLILDLRALATTGLLTPDLAEAASGPDLSDLLALGRHAMRALRHRLFELLLEGSPNEAELAALLYPAGGCTMLLPTRPPDYTDFYAGIVHATNVGRLLRPDNPLMPNYKWIPIGYHGRTSSIRPSGTSVRRPSGQLRGPDDDAPRFGPSERLDYEVELGLWVGTGNALGEPVPIGEAAHHLAGVTLLNDWSARDIQAWEYQPLGPFLAKNFATTVSPWLVTMEALAPFRTAQIQRPDGDPAPLPYLYDPADQANGAVEIEIEVLIITARMRAEGSAPERLGKTSSAHLYWTPAQLVAHHSSNGCALEPGDLLGTGTISAPERGGFGSLMEISKGGREPFALANGETRRFLEDGDTVLLRGTCARDGYARIGLGECSAEILSVTPDGERT